ncbi:hypothetical protein [Streptomyces xylophagus]|uniref:hypothetical protein n=1 Tax=Streptomyces xylophagus TaxID=285514 RepID=UPI0005B900FC|nr:hypothetical protein [Streptomyces xylophagus]
MSDPTPQKNQAPGTTSDGSAGRLVELAQKAEEAQRTVAASVAEDRQKLTAVVADAKGRAEQGAQRLQSSGQQAKANVTGTWNQVQTSWQDHVDSVRVKLEERKAERDVKRLQNAADDAEDYASDAVDFAIAAVEEAEYATLDAVLARVEADEAADAAQ